MHFPEAILPLRFDGSFANPPPAKREGGGSRGRSLEP